MDSMIAASFPQTVSLIIAKFPAKIHIKIPAGHDLAGILHILYLDLHCLFSKPFIQREAGKGFGDEIPKQGL
ncbi:MAG: hypothetical protein U0J65_03100, partial [Christensenellales bacterium]|nr:hypothetical protein [Christensenellales bacterium]